MFIAHFNMWAFPAHEKSSISKHMNKKNRRNKSTGSEKDVSCLLSRDCSLRANICASAAVDAGIRINGVDVAFRNSAYRAF